MNDQFKPKIIDRSLARAERSQGVQAGAVALENLAIVVLLRAFVCPHSERALDLNHFESLRRCRCGDSPGFNQMPLNSVSVQPLKIGWQFS